MPLSHNGLMPPRPSDSGTHAAHAQRADIRRDSESGLGLTTPRRVEPFAIFFAKEGPVNWYKRRTRPELVCRKRILGASRTARSVRIRTHGPRPWNAGTRCSNLFWFPPQRGPTIKRSMAWVGPSHRRNPLLWVYIESAPPVPPPPPPLAKPGHHAVARKAEHPYLVHGQLRLLGRPSENPDPQTHITALAYAYLTLLETAPPPRPGHTARDRLLSRVQGRASLLIARDSITNRRRGASITNVCVRHAPGRNAFWPAGAPPGPR